jgi:hypothetical protein
MDMILPDVIALARQADYERSQAHAAEKEALLREIAEARAECQDAVHKIQELQDSNEELALHRDRLAEEKIAAERLLAAAKDDLEIKSRDIQNLQASSDSARSSMQQQLDASLQTNMLCSQQAQMLETDLRAAKEREAELQSAMQTLHDEFRDKEASLTAQVDAAVEAASRDRLHARSREEDMRVECAIANERLQHASEAAAADLALLQQQLETAVSKARDAAKSRDVVEEALAQREQQHADAMRLLTIESSQNINALESKLFQQAQLHASIQQELHDSISNREALETRLREVEALHHNLIQQHSGVTQAYSSARAELESLHHANEEIKAQHDQKMQLLLQQSAQNQERLHDLQKSLQKEQSLGQDAILAGSEVLQELTRLKLQM